MNSNFEALDALFGANAAARLFNGLIRRLELIMTSNVCKGGAA